MHDSGQNYIPVNLAPEFQKEGLRVHFTATRYVPPIPIINDPDSFRPWGTAIKLLEIKCLASIIFTWESYPDVVIASSDDFATAIYSPPTPHLVTITKILIPGKCLTIKTARQVPLLPILDEQIYSESLSVNAGRCQGFIEHLVSLNNLLSIFQ